MAIESPVNEVSVSLELVRELLIAISQSTPKNLVTSHLFYEHSDGLNEAVLKNKNNPEELRSELISISSVPSPDKITLLPTGVQEA